MLSRSCWAGIPAGTRNVGTTGASRCARCSGRTRRHTVLGLALGVGAWAVSPYLALWMLPVVLGLALAVPLAELTGRRSLGVGLRAMGLLRIPEESQPPEVLQQAAALQQAARAAHPEMATATASAASVPTLLQDASLLLAHQRMLPPPRRPGIDPLNVALLTGTAKLQETDDFAAVWADLSAAEKNAVLSDEQALRRLRALQQR